MATDAARRAGAVQRGLFERLERITPKGKRDVVTEADFRSEAVILEAIREAFPGDAIVAEESGAHGVTLEEAVDGPRGPAAAKRAWFVDPLDGTINFANGLPFFCVAIGLAVAGRPVLGVIHDPIRDELLQAVGGAGAWRDGTPFRVGTKRVLGESVLGLVHRRGSLRLLGQLRREARAVRDMGSAALAIAYVGGSRLDGYVQLGGLAPWDLCAAGLIAVEGGATVTAFDGGPWFRYPDRGRGRRRGPPTLSAVVAAPAIHSQLLSILGAAGG